MMYEYGMCNNVFKEEERCYRALCTFPIYNIKPLGSPIVLTISWNWWAGGVEKIPSVTWTTDYLNLSGWKYFPSLNVNQRFRFKLQFFTAKIAVQAYETSTVLASDQRYMLTVSFRHFITKRNYQRYLIQ